MKFKRFLSVALAVALVFSTVATVSAGSSEFGAMEFVVTANKTSVVGGETVTITITGNGRMSNLSTVQYQIIFDSAEFTTGTNAKKAFDADYYAEVSGGNGIGAIAKPSFGQQDGADGTKIGTVVVMDSARSGEDEEGNEYMLFISEGCDLYGKTTATFGKIVFTAQVDIADVSDCFTLTSAKTAYHDISGSLATNIFGTVIQLSETMAVTKVMGLIDTIGSPVTYSSKAAIEAARSAYDAITSESVKEQITNIATLTAAEAALKAITDEIARVKGLIDNLNGESTTFRADIENAAQAYYGLASDARESLADYDAKLQAAWAEYEDRTEAAEVDALIDLIGDVTLDSKAAIEAAEAAWGKLTATQQGYVKNHDILTQARQDYNTISANKEAAMELEELINAIPAPITRDNAEKARRTINTARSSYNSAGEAVRNFVGEAVYKKLTDAEAELAVADKDIADAVAVEKLIDAIGEVTLASKAKLTEIETKLSGISAAAVSYIDEGKMSVYDAACERYTVLEEEQARVQAVIDEIAALGDVEDITLEDKEAIESAEAAFDLLTTALQDRVTNAKDLRNIRAKLDALIKSEAAVNNVIKLIDEIGEVTLNSSAKISAARGAYDNLTEDEQARVDNYTVLTAAEELYKQIFEVAEQEKIDQAAADGVEELIYAIGEVVLTDKCEALIKAAEVAYAGLTDHQKELVENYETLTQARSDYNALKADKEAVDEVIAIIDAIGTVEYTDECLAKIEAAQEAYNDLREDLQGRVTNADKIAFSKERYAQLKADAEAVAEVIAAIDNIGDVSWTKESLEKIEAARKAYDALRDDLKQNIANADVLTEAEEAYESLKPVFKQELNVEAYNGKHMTVVTNVPENMIVSDGISDAALVKIGENIYHVFVTEYAVDEADIVLRHDVPYYCELGDVDANGRITANDAQMACQYAARNSVPVFETDPMAFVRADVNGNGKITALDALMIANKAADLKDVEFTLLVGMIQNAQ